MRRVIVVGSGIAGLTAALHARAAGALVTVVTKGLLGDGNTPHAQGGLAAAVAPGDSTELHLADTLTAGAGLSDPAAVRVLVDDAAARVRELVAAGVVWDADVTGAPLYGLEAAHSAHRILHAGGDATGRAIADALTSTVRATSITVLERAFLVDLRTSDDTVDGVLLIVDGRRVTLTADAVILATGGAGALFAHTTNPAGATADGIGAALRAGAAVADLEFVQFHPTALQGGFLVSEAVRGEGAVLRDESGRRFTFDAHPDGELAPRDVVARANHAAMAMQGGRPVHLDATAIGAERLAARFPTIDAELRRRGIDWSVQTVPVTPAAHYLMGGVVTDLRGRTTMPGLWAVGECARTGVHGANRLASNSLLEGAVFGARAGDDAAAGGGRAVEHPVETPADEPVGEPATPFTRAGLQELLWDSVGLVRDERGLAHAARTITTWRRAAQEPGDVTGYENRNLLDVAAAMVRAARARTASVGAHHRSDDATAPVAEGETAC